jgi:hypothetical protein
MHLINSQSLLLIDTVTVASSSLATLAYDNQRTLLQVEFQDGSAHQYVGVPLQTYEALLRANSKGAYFNHFIRNLYPSAILRTAASSRVRLNGNQ